MFRCSVITLNARYSVIKGLNDYHRTFASALSILFLLQTDGCTVVVRPYETNLLGFHSGTYVQGTEGTILITRRLRKNLPPLLLLQ